MLRLLTDEDVHGDIVHGLRRRQPTLDLVRVHDVGEMAQVVRMISAIMAAGRGRGATFSPHNGPADSSTV